MLNRINNIIILDQVSNLENGSFFLVVKLISTMKIIFLKLKKGLGETEKGVVLDTIGGIKIGIGKDSKWFIIESIVVCRGVDELDLNQEVAEKEKEKVRDLLDDVIVLDYIFPNSLSSVNL
ncbi:hypothetical protein MKX01_020512 [Papaver californicum]|nr:hypothetical protein MKX01_020512 [Papaver californicum]